MSKHAIKPLFTPDIDHFLGGFSGEGKNKLWKVVNSLRFEHELTGSISFPIPLDKLQRNRASKEDALAILRNLHRNKIIDVTVKHKVKYSTPTTPALYSLKNIDERPEIFGDKKTVVSLDKEKFSYLVAKLRPIIHPEESFQALQKIENSYDEKDCIISSRALKLVAREMDLIEGLKGSELGRFLRECGVDKEIYSRLLVVSPPAPTAKDVWSAKNIFQASQHPVPPPTKADYEKNTRAMLIYRILLFYSCGQQRNQGVLFKILQESTHPLLFAGDETKSMAFQESINRYLIHAGFSLNNGKVERRIKGFKPKVSIVSAPSREAQVRVLKAMVARNEERDKIATEVLKKLQETKTSPLNALRTDKEHLGFYPETGDITLRGEGDVMPDGKSFAPLTILSSVKNTPFSLDPNSSENKGVKKIPITKMTVVTPQKSNFKRYFLYFNDDYQYFYPMPLLRKGIGYYDTNRKLLDLFEGKKVSAPDPVFRNHVNIKFFNRKDIKDRYEKANLVGSLKKNFLLKVNFEKKTRENLSLEISKYFPKE